MAFLPLGIEKAFKRVSILLIALWQLDCGLWLYEGTLIPDLTSHLFVCQEEILDETDEYVNIHNRLVNGTVNCHNWELHQRRTLWAMISGWINPYMKENASDWMYIYLLQDKGQHACFTRKSSWCRLWAAVCSVSPSGCSSFWTRSISSTSTSQWHKLARSLLQFPKESCL